MQRKISRLLRLTDTVAVAALAVLLATVAAAILGRLLFDLSGGRIDLAPSGAIELSRLALLVLVLAALPGAAARGLVRVELVVQSLPAPLAGALERLWHGLVAVLAAMLAWLLAGRALDEFGRGDVSQDLGFALWPFSAFAALAALALALVAAWRAIGPKR